VQMPVFKCRAYGSNAGNYVGSGADGKPGFPNNWFQMMMLPTETLYYLLLLISIYPSYTERGSRYAPESNDASLIDDGKKSRFPNNRFRMRTLFE